MGEAGAFQRVSASRAALGVGDVRDPSCASVANARSGPGAPKSSSPFGTSDAGQIAESLLAGTNARRACAQAPGEEEVRDLRGRQRSSAPSASRAADGA
jgi:hypothetical protein